MRRAFVTAAALVLGATAWPSAASADDTVQPDGQGRIAVRGHGFGHGHGMSQYGAEGAARQGMSYRQILDFYYPGTTTNRTSPKVRVLITADTTDSVVVLAADGLAVRDTADGATFRLPDVRRSGQWRLVPATHRPTRTKVQYARGGSWHRWKLPGRTLFKGDGEFVKAGPKTLVLPSGARKVYRGALRSASPSAASRTRDTVNITKLDKYVQGVIPAEMPASWHQEALRSQAVAARTYAAQQLGTRRAGHYQICDTTACQVYGGKSAETASTNAAVRATRHTILTYGGSPAFTQFSSSSGGWTSYGGYRYLPTQKDPYDGWSGNGVHDWRTTLHASSIERAYPWIGRLKAVRVLERSGNGSWGGRVGSVRITGSKGHTEVSGDAMRSAFGLRSNWFKLG
ncbi:MAG: SpoIID/LytB domain-containing protein [Nocardioidaceae bacterium]